MHAMYTSIDTTPSGNDMLKKEFHIVDAFVVVVVVVLMCKCVLCTVYMFFLVRERLPWLFTKCRCRHCHGCWCCCCSCCCCWKCCCILAPINLRILTSFRSQRKTNRSFICSSILFHIISFHFILCCCCFFLALIFVRLFIYFDFDFHFHSNQFNMAFEWFG